MIATNHQVLGNWVANLGWLAGAAGAALVFKFVLGVAVSTLLMVLFVFGVTLFGYVWSKVSRTLATRDLPNAQRLTIQLADTHGQVQQLTAMLVNQAGLVQDRLVAQHELGAARQALAAVTRDRDSARGERDTALRELTEARAGLAPLASALCRALGKPTMDPKDADAAVDEWKHKTDLATQAKEVATELRIRRECKDEDDAARTVFDAATGLSVDLEKAAKSILAERAKAAADRDELNTKLINAIDSENVAGQYLKQAERARDMALGNIEKSKLAQAQQQASLVQGTRDFWTPDRSIRLFLSPLVPGNGNYSCIVPQKDGTAKVRVRLFAVNTSPFEVRVTNVKIHFNAMKSPFEMSGDYDGPPGEMPDSTIFLEPFQQRHFFLTLKGTIKNVDSLTSGCTEIAYIYLNEAYATLKGQWDTPKPAHLTTSAMYLLVSWGDFR